jgi:molybdenum cofactor guanylyltransferase
VVERLRPQVSALAICGRDAGADPCIDLAHLADQPEPGLGPLGGLLAALLYAERIGLDAVLTSPVDAPLLPTELATKLGSTAPSYATTAERAQPAFGLWPAGLAPDLRDYLAHGKRSLMGWAERCSAQAVLFKDAGAFANVNRPEDLAELRASS